MPPRIVACWRRRGRTIAVLGCGPDVVYPTEHRGLMSEIIGHGAVMSEFAPGTPPRPGEFPLRNRIVSGLSCAALTALECRGLVTAWPGARYNRRDVKTMMER